MLKILLVLKMDFKIGVQDGVQGGFFILSKMYRNFTFRLVDLRYYVPTHLQSPLSEKNPNDLYSKNMNIWI